MSATDPVRVNIGDLLRDPDFQVRAELDAGTVARYTAVLASEVELPPIRVAVVDGVPVVVDGWHRLAAAEKAGRYQVDAMVIPDVKREDALWMAAAANLTHGLPLKSKEVREVFRTYMRTKRYLKPCGKLKSYREIATELGGLKRHTTIRIWMQQDFPRVAARYSGEDSGTGEKGGLGETGGSWMSKALTGLEEALAAARGVRDPEERGRLVEAFRAALKDIEGGREWTPTDF